MRLKNRLNLSQSHKKKSAPAVPMATSVNLIVDTPKTETALSEMLNGRFLVDTEQAVLPNRKSTGNCSFVEELLSRWINGDYYFLDPSGDRISLNELDASIVDLDHYALHRPRNVSPVDYTYLSSSIEPETRCSWSCPTILNRHFCKH